MKKTKKNLMKLMAITCLSAAVFVAVPATVYAESGQTYTQTYYIDPEDRSKGTVSDVMTLEDNEVISGDYVLTINKSGKETFLKDVVPIDVTKQDGNLVIPSGVTVIEGASSNYDDGDNNDPYITSVTLPDTVTAIDSMGGTRITELKVPGSVKYIASGALAFNRQLKTVTLEEGVEHLDMNVFQGCTALRDAYLPSTIKKMSYNWTDQNPFNGIEKKVTVHAPKGSFVYNYCKDILGMKVVDTKQATAKPSKITSLKTSNVKQNSIKLTWKKASNADGYVIYQKSGSKWEQIKTTGKTNVTIKSLQQNKKYEFKVVAYRSINGKTVSGKAATITKKTAKMAKPNAVKNLKTSKVTKNTVTLKWSKVKKNKPTGYIVYQKKGKKWVKLDTVSAKKTNYRVANLKGKTKYTFKIITENKRAYGTSKSKAVTINVKTK